MSKYVHYRNFKVLVSLLLAFHHQRKRHLAEIASNLEEVNPQTDTPQTPLERELASEASVNTLTYIGESAKVDALIYHTAVPLTVDSSLTIINSVHDHLVKTRGTAFTPEESSAIKGALRFMVGRLLIDTTDTFFPDALRKYIDAVYERAQLSGSDPLDIAKDEVEYRRLLEAACTREGYSHMLRMDLGKYLHPTKCRESILLRQRCREALGTFASAPIELIPDEEIQRRLLAARTIFDHWLEQDIWITFGQPLLTLPQ